MYIYANFADYFASTAFLSSFAVPATEQTRLGHFSPENDSFLLEAIRSKTIKPVSHFC